MEEQVGKHLKMIRNVKRFSQKQFSEFLGVSLRSYEKWEQGNRLPDLGSLIKIADRLGVSIDWLVGRTENFYLVNALDIEKYFEEKL